MAETHTDCFKCPVCLNLMKDPVAIPCGHNYCLGCIDGYWDQEDGKGIYSCPQCRKAFQPRPALSKNCLIAEMVKKAELHAVAQAQSPAGLRDVDCDSNTGNKLRTSKLRSQLRHAEQMDESNLLPPSLCTLHGKPTDIFCCSDQSYICSLCLLEDHKKHDVLKLRDRAHNTSFRRQMSALENERASTPPSSPTSPTVCKPAVKSKPKQRTHKMTESGKLLDENVEGSETPWKDVSENLCSAVDRLFEKPKEESDSVRVVLVGKTGVGKSATGNTILGKTEFESNLSQSSVTIKCKKRAAMIGARELQVIDTPGLFDTNVSNEKIKEEIGKCITMASPGPHVFLLLLSVGRFTQEERETVKIIQEVFGARSKAYTMVGFTKGEELKENNTSIEKYIESGQMKGLLQECGGRYHVFYNKEKNNKHQVSSFLEKIDKMIIQNEGYYTTSMFEETEENIKARERVLLKRKMEEELKRSSKVISFAHNTAQLVTKERNLSKPVKSREEEICVVPIVRGEPVISKDKRNFNVATEQVTSREEIYLNISGEPVKSKEDERNVKVTGELVKSKEEENNRNVTGEPVKSKDEQVDNLHVKGESVNSREKLSPGEIRLHRRMDSMEENILAQLAKCRPDIRRKAEEDEAKATAKTLKTPRSKCSIS